MPRRQTKKYKKQRGGVYIGKGTYGCTFGRPALRCEGEAARRPGKISKLMYSEHIAGELQFRDLLSPIDPDQKYFIYPDISCSPAPLEPSDQLDNCPHNFSDLHETSILIQPDGGENLEEILLSASDFIPFFRSLRGLMVGLQKIHAVGISHNDIKPPNIVSQKQPDGTFLTRFIDFGLMINATTLDTEVGSTGRFPRYRIFTTNYMYWPFEVRLLYPPVNTRALAREEESRAEYNEYIKNQINMFYENIPLSLLSIPARALRTTPLSYGNVGIMANTYSHMPPTSKYASIFSGCDIHGFGMTLSQIYVRFLGHRDRGVDVPDIVIRDDDMPAWKPTNSSTFVSYSPESLEWHREVARDISRPLYNLIRRMIDTNPQERIKIAGVIEAYDMILPAVERLFTASNIRSHIKSFATPNHTRASTPAPETQPSPKPFELSPLVAEPNITPSENGKWITVGPRGKPKKGGSRKTRRNRR